MLYTLRILYYSSFFWVPALLMLGLFELWLTYKRSIWLSDVNPKEAKRSILLEIKAPRDVFKSPKAMEFFINGLYKTDDEDTNYNIYWNGQVRPNFSLEIVSIDGNVRFFVRTPRWLKPPVESNLYSQYPGIEIFEVPDYTLPVKYDPEIQGLWGAEFKLRKDSDVLPIRTYVDFGMDKDPKEEFKIDPLTPFIEYIGQWGRGHQMWLQILVRAHKNEHPDPTDPKKDLRWGEEAKKQIDKIINETRGQKDKEDKLIPGTSRLITEDEKATMEAIARKQNKNAYDVGMRFIYTAPKDIFVTSNLTGAVGALMNFGHASNLNGLATVRATGSKHVKSYYEFILKGKKKREVDAEKRNILDAYKHRGYFYNEYKQPYFILNSEELATLFHLPGAVSTTPTYERIQSTKAEAPANLPV